MSETQSQDQAHSSQDVFSRIAQEQEGYLEELKDYLRIPSISTDPAYDPEVRRCAEFVLEKNAPGRSRRPLDRNRRQTAGLR